MLKLARMIFKFGPEMCRNGAKKLNNLLERSFRRTLIAFALMRWRNFLIFLTFCMMLKLCKLHFLCFFMFSLNLSDSMVSLRASFYLSLFIWLWSNSSKEEDFALFVNMSGLSFRLITSACSIKLFCFFISRLLSFSKTHKEKNPYWFSCQLYVILKKRRIIVVSILCGW